MKIHSPNFKNLLGHNPALASFVSYKLIQPHGITTIDSRDFCSLDYFKFNKWNGDIEWSPFNFKRSLVGNYVFGNDFNWFRITNNYNDPTKGFFHFYGFWEITTDINRAFSMSFTPPDSIGSLIYTGTDNDTMATITTDFTKVDISGLRITTTNTSPPTILVGVTSTSSSQTLNLNINGVAKINMYS
jgi:hypothetical protein